MGLGFFVFFKYTDRFIRDFLCMLFWIYVWLKNPENVLQLLHIQLQIVLGSSKSYLRTSQRTIRLIFKAQLVRSI